MKRYTSESEYTPKTSVLINGEMVVFKLLLKSDGPALEEFFAKIPESETDLLRSDVRNPEVIAAWVESIDYSRVLPVVAWSENGELIAGVSSLHFTQGVYRHIADIRIVVGVEYRKLGLG